MYYAEQTTGATLSSSLHSDHYVSSGLAHCQGELTSCCSSHGLTSTLSHGYSLSQPAWYSGSEREAFLRMEKQCEVFSKRTTTLRRNIHEILQLPQTVQIKRILVAPGTSFTKCTRESHTEAAARVIEGLRLTGHVVRIAAPREALASSCVNKVSNLDLVDSSEHDPYDFLLCFSFENCGPNIHRATYRGLAMPIDSTSFNYDARWQTADESAQNHINTFKLFKRYMHVVFGISSIQLLAWRALTDVYDQKLAKQHGIDAGSRVVDETMRSYSVLHNTLPAHTLVKDANSPIGLRDNRARSFEKMVYGFLGGYAGPQRSAADC